MAAEPDGPKIYLIGESILSQKARLLTITEITQDQTISKSVEVAHEALEIFRRKNGFGRAIAAPQVGFPLRFVAINLGQPETLFNPVITYRSSETFTMWDDCLSFPDLMVRVRRHTTISVEYIDKTGCICIWNHLSQALSELLQHEIDHLDGILAVSLKEDPVGVDLSGIVKRDEWLRNRHVYDALVDYTSLS